MFLGGVYFLALGYPPALWSVGIIELEAKLELIYGTQSLAGKILSRKDLADVSVSNEREASF